MDIVKLLNYMENLRYDRKMNQEFYLHDVISQRQYYRYRSGESEVPFEVIIKLANKLQIPLLKLISNYQTYAAKEIDLVREYLNLVMSKKLDQASKLIKGKKSFMLLDEEIEVFYQIALVLHKYYGHQINTENMILLLKTKSNFTEIMNKSVLHDSEIYLLGVIMEYSDEDRTKILEKIINLRKNDKLLLGGNALFNSQVFFWIIKNLGRMNRFNELIEIANEAIKYSKHNYSYYSIEYFYYFKALAHYELKNHEEFELALTQTICFLSHYDDFKRNHFINTIKKDTNIDCKEFIIDKIKKEF
ncbi:MAG: hypothetical protein RBQ97_09705 [Acholeplasma sp.]|nr:hypothetical protein [Acholeplasma sp.]